MQRISMNTKIQNILIEKEKVSLSQIDEILTCPCCLELIRDPHQPPCGHSFCKACIQNIDRCPCCRKAIPLNQDLEKQISKNFMLNEFLEKAKIYKCLSSECHWSTYSKKIHNKHLNSCKYVKQKMVIIEEENDYIQKKIHSNNNQYILRMPQNNQIQNYRPAHRQQMHYPIPFQSHQNPLEYFQQQDQFGRNQITNINYFFQSCCQSHNQLQFPNHGQNIF
ncbi:hypothetical protein ABPG74_022780 [Tetrahymena malaccensis]